MKLGLPKANPPQPLIRLNNMSEQKKDFSLEESLKEIREILEKMELSTMDFDENIKMFTRGTSLIKECRTYLDESELMIRKLIDSEEGPEEQEFE